MTISAIQPARARSAKRGISRLLGAAAFAMAAGLAMTEANAQGAMGWLELKPASGRNSVQITAHALALEKIAGLEFTMSVQHEGRGGKSSSRQSGRLDLAAGETKVLSSTAIAIEPGDNLTVILRLMEHGQEVFSTVMSAKPGPERQTL